MRRVLDAAAVLGLLILATYVAADEIRNPGQAA